MKPLVWTLPKDASMQRVQALYRLKAAWHRRGKRARMRWIGGWTLTVSDP